MNDQKCSNCRFHAHHIECRRHAPRSIHNSQKLWPIVFDYEWCGDWEKRSPYADDSAEMNP